MRDQLELVCLGAAVEQREESSLGAGPCVPAPGPGGYLGTEDDYRVPDGAIHRPGPDQMYYETAALVVEIVSPGDESWAKLPFYAAHHVDELLIVDPEEHAVHWLGLDGGEYRPIERSGLIDLGPSELAEQIDWP